MERYTGITRELTLRKRMINSARSCNRKLSKTYLKKLKLHELLSFVSPLIREDYRKEIEKYYEERRINSKDN